MKKSMICLVFAAMLALTGCQGENTAAKEPVAIEIWHYYNGAQQDEFNRLVTVFNKTVGAEKGIAVSATGQGTIDDLESNVLDAIQGKAGALEVPNIFAAYGDTAYEVDQLGYVVDLSQYFSEEELAEYVEGYIEEGRFAGEESLKIFPTAKSIELLMLNQTDWDKFAAATGADMAQLSTVEGVTETARQYYEWTDSLTAEPNDGRAFFGRDAMANYMLVGYRQLSEDIFSHGADGIELHFEKDVVRKLWDNYYVPYIRGYFSSAGKFRSDDIKVGNILACVSSSSGVTYFPSEVVLNDEESYPIKLTALACPKFRDGKDFQVQQGAGMVVLKASQEEQQASAEFLRWFTSQEQNIAFSTASGYLPVKSAANDIGQVEKQAELTPAVKEVLEVSFQTIHENRMYTQTPFAEGTAARHILESSMSELAKTDRQAVKEKLENGMTLDEAVSLFESDDYFEQWYEATKQELEALLD